ncbi:hypothetical protein [Pseudomonas syringae]|nr:hypothetical protein [Pseudomonas syringae]
MTDEKKVDAKPAEKPVEKPKPNPAAKRPEVIMVLNHADKITKR